MIHEGTNLVNGIVVTVERKRIRRINLRVTAEGAVRLSIPMWRATLRAGEAFLADKWSWVVAVRTRLLARRAAEPAPVTADEIEAFRLRLGELHADWARRVNEPGVFWSVRRLKSIWGSCHWVKRRITYNAELVRAPRELVEYVVVHEFTHFAAHDHGPRFRALMDARLPDWRERRRRLAHREGFSEPVPPRHPSPPGASPAPEPR